MFSSRYPWVYQWNLEMFWMFLENIILIYSCQSQWWLATFAKQDSRVPHMQQHNLSPEKKKWQQKASSFKNNIISENQVPL